MDAAIVVAKVEPTPYPYPMRREATLGGIFLVASALCACGGDDATMTDGGREASISPSDGAAGSKDGGGGDGDTSDAANGALCACDSSACEETVAISSGQHVAGLVIDTDPPPAGGPHDPCWADYGVYSDELPAANWVHNLEHGAIVLLYHCPNGCDDDIADLAQFTQDHPRTLLTPYSPMSARFAAIAWGHRLLMECLDLQAIQAFYDAHFDMARESVASGKPAECP